MTKLHPQTGDLLNLSAAHGEDWGEERKRRKEGEDKQHSQAATSASVEAAIACPGCSSCTLGRAHHHSCLFPLQVGLTASTYWDSRRQPKARTVSCQSKTYPLQQTRMTFPLNHHLDLCLWQTTIFSYFFFSCSQWYKIELDKHRSKRLHNTAALQWFLL